MSAPRDPLFQPARPTSVALTACAPGLTATSRFQLPTSLMFALAVTLATSGFAGAQDVPEPEPPRPSPKPAPVPPPVDPVQPKQPETKPPAPSRPKLTTDEEIEAVIALLGHDDWLVREAAGDALSALGPTAIPVAARAFVRSRDPEIRQRLPEMYRTYYWTHVAGFLGVRMEPEPQPGGGLAVRVRDVVPGSAAAKGGIQAEDLIVAFDGRPLAELSRIEEFSARVIARGQARPTVMKVLRETIRGNEPVDCTVALGPMPDDYIRLRNESVDPVDMAHFDRWWQEQVKAAALRERTPKTIPAPPVPPAR